MSALIPYVQIRGETYYYVRRVPLDVIRCPLEFKHVFKGQATVRWSLHTKDKGEALIGHGLRAQCGGNFDPRTGMIGRLDAAAERLVIRPGPVHRR